MNNERMNLLERLSVKPVVAAFYVMSAGLITAYIVLYQYSPLAAPFNDIVLNSIITVGALAASLVATSIFRQYRLDDQPRRVWRNIMIAAWLWFMGELLWQIYAYFTESDVPVPSLADAFWVGGFVFFTIAFYHQYAIVTPTSKDTIRTFIIAAWLVALLIPAVCLSLTDSFSIEYYIEFYYPIADLAVGFAGLALVLIFRGGALMRPWLGLMVFGVSDLLYAWGVKTDLYAASAESGNFLSLVIDTTYLGAYLIMGIGYLGQWLLLRYGIQPGRK